MKKPALLLLSLGFILSTSTATAAADWIESRTDVDTKIDLLNAFISNRERLDILTEYRKDLETRQKFLTLGHLGRILNGFTNSDSARMLALELLIGITDTQFGKDESVLSRLQSKEKKTQAQELLNQRKSSQN